jgi:S-adenosylmethionine synthetase
MYPKNMFFTSESVTEGHPDKFCDQISDVVLDECLKQDSLSRVACECYVTMGLLNVGGEVTTNALFDVAYGFDVNTGAVVRTIHAQSPDISMGVSKKAKKIGAGDQGLMFGYACNQTKELMQLPITLAHKLAMKLSQVRKKKVLPYLGPDGKTQVTVAYRDGKAVRVDYVVIAASHTDEVVTPDGKFTTGEAEQEIVDRVVQPVVGDLLDKKSIVTVNGTGKFLVSGPQSDTGLTGRKIIVDTYGRTLLKETILWRKTLS